MVGVDLGQLLGDRVAEVGHPQRVEPEVRVVALVLVTLVVVLVPARSQVDDVGGVEHLALGGLVDGLVDGRLEAALVDDQVGARRPRRSP